MKRFFLILSCSALLSGCATIIRGTSEKFTVDSIPQGADVQISTGQSGVTPFSVKVPRSQTLQVSVSKPGYKTQQLTVPAEVSSGGAVATAANLFAFRDLGGLIGAAVDASDGSAMEHKPNPLVVQLEKQ
jgi:hypothetical protein